MGSWQPSAAAFAALIAPEAAETDASRPYPFFLASQLAAEPETLGAPAEWLVEWKRDGIRAQLVRRAGGVFPWARGAELITGRFPDRSGGGDTLPEGTGLDGQA